MKCRICSNESGNRRHTAREMMFGYRDAFEYSECSNCECLQIVDIPGGMQEYYPDNYYSYARIPPQSRLRKSLSRLKDRYAVSGRGLVGKLLYRRFPDVALRSLSYLELDHTTRFLDVGCGAGGLLNAMSDLDFRNLLGVDPFLPADVDYRNGVKLLRQTIHDVDGEFDVIMFHHAFEHIADPARTLKTVGNLLPPGGNCIIRIPTVSSYAWHHYGINWVQLDAPRHFYLHSVRSVKLLADRAGLELCKVVYDSSAFQFWGSEQYARDIPLHDSRSYLVSPNASLFSKGQIADFQRRAVELNRADRGDQAVFYLRKPKK